MGRKGLIEENKYLKEKVVDLQSENEELSAKTDKQEQEGAQVLDHLAQITTERD